MNLKSLLHAPKLWMYRGGRPNWMANALNRLSAELHKLGIAPNYLVTLEVRGRKSGRTISLPLVMAVVEGGAIWFPCWERTWIGFATPGRRAAT